MGVLTKTPSIQAKLRRPLGADVVRIGAAGLVGWFHIWQQSWVSPGRLEPLVRTGYVWVDMMILLSGFCLFLPYAADAVQGLPMRSSKGFYRRRAWRILPAYFVCVAVHLAVALVQSGWTKELRLDLAAHLTLTQTFFAQSYWYTRLGGALWTVGILAGFYLLFPLLAKGMLRFPLQTAAAMMAVQLGFSLFALRLEGINYQMAFNRLPAFTGVFWLGMVTAAVYARLVAVDKKGIPLLFGAGALGCFGAIFLLVKHSLLTSENIQRWQLQFRMPLALLFAGLLLCLCLALPAANKKGLLAFFAAISYSFYLWHQSIAVWLKQARIPHWTGDVSPNQLGDSRWMHHYNLLCWAAALAVATLSFYLCEKLPAALKARKNGR